jgi:hypothetical protein
MNRNLRDSIISVEATSLLYGDKQGACAVVLVSNHS